MAIGTLNTKTLSRTGRKLIRNKAFVSLIVLSIGMTIASPHYLTGHNLLGLLSQSVAYTILGLGLTTVVIAGGVDLSIGGVMCLAGVVTIGLYPTVPTWLAAIIAIALGGLIGFINGFFSVHQKSEPFIITIGMMLFLKGINLQLTDGRGMGGKDMAFMEFGFANLGGIPVTVIIAVALVIVFHLIMNRTAFGRNLYAIGGDYDVAVYSGINAMKLKWSTYVISGMTAAIGGIMLSARFFSASAIYGDFTAYIILSSIVIGGTSLMGGIGGILASVVGIILFNAIENSMNLLALGSYTQQTVQGILIVVIIGMELYSIKRRREKV